MKKKNLIASCLLLSSILAGCSCDKKDVDTHANVSYENKEIISNKNGQIIVGDVYNYILNNQQDDVAKNILLNIMEEQIEFEDPEDPENTDMLDLYKRYLTEYFEETFVNNSAYSYDGEFSEELLVKYLKSESYDIKCGTGVTAGMIDNSNFTCDYSDYINKEVNYDIYMKMLKIQYIFKEKSDLIDKNNARLVTYYSVTKGSDDTAVRKEMEEYVKSIEANYDSDDASAIRSIEDIATTKRKEDLDNLEKERAKVSTSQDSSDGFPALIKFTTCGNKRCSLDDGEIYQQNLILEKEYYSTEVVIKNNTSILYEEARDLLFSDNITDYLYKIGDKNYLVSPAYGLDGENKLNDIILYDSSKGMYFLAEVKVIDSKSLFDDKVLVAELLLDKISDSTILSYICDETDINIYDKDIKKYFESEYGKIN